MNKNKKEEEKATNHQYNTSEIEQIIDEIIVKNKEKLDKIYEKEIDTIKLAFRDRGDNTIFFLRKKTDKKPVNIEEIHGEIIAEAKNKLGETASKSKTEKDKTAEAEVKKEKKKRKIDSKIDLPSIQETLERRSSSVENYDTVTKSVDELLESDELYEVVSDFEKELKIDEPRELEDEAKIIDEKLKKTPVVEETKEKEDVAEKKSKELAEKHGFFKEKKTTGDSLLKKEENNVTESDVDETKKLDEKEKKFLDEKILSVSSEKKLKDKKKKEWKKEKTKERKFFFKRGKLEVKTGEVLGSKKKKKSRVFKPRFHVENLPTKDTKFLDENIKKKQEIKEEQIFPGYLLVKMIVDEHTWSIISSTDGIRGFVRTDKYPKPLPEKEVKAIMKFMEVEQPAYQASFNVGEAVKIIEGAFADFIGSVESIDNEKGKVNIMISFLGREAPVEVDFSQVSKL